MFTHILKDTPLSRLRSSKGAEGVKFSQEHMVHELEAPAQFLAAEIVGQPLRRIDERYPVKRVFASAHRRRRDLPRRAGDPDKLDGRDDRGGLLGR